MRAINTLFNGDYFRSRLEARWAVFLTHLGVKYEYEPQGYVNKSGKCYLPDFYLPSTYLRDSMGVYIEIKPESHEGLVPASEWFDKNFVLFKGIPSLNIWGSWDDNPQWANGGFELYPRDDDKMHFFICCCCGGSKIDFADSSNNACPKCNSECDEDLLITAANIAQIARFEHK